MNRVGVSFALSAALLWGISGTIAASAFAEMSPARIAQGRSIIAVAVLVPLAAKMGKLATEGQLRRLFVLGSLLAVVTVTFYWALDRLGVGPGTTVQFLGPILILVYMKRVQRRPVASVAWAAAAVAIIGVAMVTRAWDLAALDPIGLAAGLVSAAAFAAYLVLGESLGARLPAITVVTYGFVFAAAIWIIVLPLWSFPFGASASAWGALIWVAIGGTVLPFLAELGALRRIPSGIVGVVATAEPVIAAVTAWVLLDQSLAAVQIAGAIAVAVAVASIQRWGLPDVEIPLEASR